jgi:4-amino-4-deoxy-L-arabinose transferase-like glycosyltransferase
VLSVWLLYATVRRWFGGVAGLLAGALLALTPVAVLMFRFNNPDALMTLLLVLAAYFVTRALENGATKWLLLTGAVMGFSFLAKGLQPFTVLPAFAIAYLFAAPTSVRRRLLQLLGAGVALVVACGWWILAVDLTPASSRPYIGGSGNNTALGLAFGYNGLSRITGGSGPGGGGANFSGAAGIGRLFNSLNGGQIAWLLPAAVVAVVALGIASLRAARTDRTRAAVIVWGGWLLVTGAVLSFATGIIHTYYTVELAPAIAALVAIGAVTMWRLRHELAARVAIAVGLLATGWWSKDLLDRATGWQPWLGPVVLAAAVVGAAAVLIAPGKLRAASAVAITAGLIAGAGGSAAYALSTAATPHTGSTPSAGPAVQSGGFGGGPGGTAGGPPSGSGFRGAPGGGAAPGGGFTPPSGGTAPSRGTARQGGANGPGGGGSATVSSALVTLLKNAGTTWSAATIGSQTAAPLELQSGTAVMAIGGFSGSDASPTLAQFEKLVAEGKIHYFVGGGSGGGGGAGGGGTGSSISSWVQAHFSATTVGGTTVYDLTKATTS